eukprot:8000717-Ditylum_brightwellii.AAC.1
MDRGHVKIHKNNLKGDEILVLGDMNGTIEDADLGPFLVEAELYNLMTAKYNKNTPLTYIQGNKTIGHMIGTTGVLNAVEKIGMACYTHYNKDKQERYN